jgi:beta-galactosidase
VSQPLGVRTFSFDPDKGFILNGKPTKLHGASRHQDRQGKGWALSAEDDAEDMASWPKWA